MTDSISEELKTFIQDVRWEYPFELTSNLSIENDLKITGDDAVEFIVLFGKEFGINVLNFEAEEYFRSEGISLDSFFDLFKKKKERTKRGLTLGDLEKAMELKILT